MFKFFKIYQANLTILRTLLICLVLFSFDAIYNFSTNINILFLGTLIGSFLGLFLFNAKLKLRGLILLIILLVSLYKLSFFIIDYLVSPENNIFSIYSFYLHFDIFGLVFLLALSSSFLFWSFRKYYSIEFILLIIFIIGIFSGHRNYRFDLLKLVNNLSWNYGYSPLVILSIIASSTLTIGFLYLYFANKYSIQFFEKKLLIESPLTNTTYKVRTFITFIITLIFIVILSKIIYQFHFKASETLVQNGVGSTSEEGMSPLDFKSALGSSNQPAAVVRFNKEYKRNPFSPMLYIRETALSSIDDQKMVLAPKIFDQDVNLTNVFDHYKRQDLLTTTLREEIDYSIYLLADHKLAFAIDYPLKINPLKIDRDKKKFKAGYAASSLAPIYNLDSLSDYKVGNPNWDKATKSHYLKKHKDIRYSKLAKELTLGENNPVKQAKIITDYFSKNAIYTLTPHHSEGEDKDPTAQFLFGDMRGYCVHFAHAGVYLLRALDIPSRIGTGYLTDLSQARDGHTLLRMSDRHAWTEVYIEDLGWVPFDPQPEQVESHAETPVDQNLLDELIDLLGTDEEIISDDLLKNEILDDNKEVLFTKNNFFILIKIIIFTLILLYLIKLYLYFSWYFTNNPNKKLKRTYFALAAIMTDLGKGSGSGKTKQEFLQSISEEYPLSYQNYLKDLNYIIYKEEINNKDFNNIRIMQFLNDLTTIDKIKIIISPVSIFRGFEKWR